MIFGAVASSGVLLSVVLYFVLTTTVTYTYTVLGMCGVIVSVTQ